MVKKTDEQKILDAEIKARKKTEKGMLKAAKKISEEEKVQRYANRVIANQGYHGRIDARKHGGMVDPNKTINKKLWMDTDFYFSVVFQSKVQKDHFLKEFTKELDFSSEVLENGGIEIINGMKLAKNIGIELKPEKARTYPLPDLDIRELILDYEEM